MTTTSSSSVNNRWPFTAYMVLVWGVLVLMLTSVSVASNFSAVDEWTLGAFTTWTESLRCQMVNVLTPTTWPALRDDVFHVGDCILRVNDYTIQSQEDGYGLSDYLATQLDERGLPWPEVEVKRGPDEIFTIIAPTMRLTSDRLLGQLLVPLMTGLFMWLLGLSVLWANPRSENNRVWAAFLFMGALVLAGALHRIEDDYFRWIVDYIVLFGPRPFLGALLFHLAFGYPQPVRPSLRRWRFALYPPAIAANAVIAHFYWSIINHAPNLYELETIMQRSITAVFGIGVLALLLRTAWVGLRAREHRYRFQAWTMIIAWLLALPMSFIDMLFRSLNISWLGHVSNLTFMFWVVPATSLIAYGMLRYQAFAYRGRALRALAIWFSAAFLTQIYAFFLSPVGVDGVQFAILLGAVVLASYLWLGDTPLHHWVHRLFMRHDYDYETVNSFTQHIAGTNSLDDCLRQGVCELRRLLEVEWTAVWVVYRPDTVQCQQANEDAILEISVDDSPPVGKLPQDPVASQSLHVGDHEIGSIWVGERISAEPFDEYDKQLLALLALSWSQALAIQVQIEQMAQTPGRILSAVESERKRIGQELHDGVLQFLGAIPLELDRAASLAPQHLEKAQRILQRNTERAAAITVETRAIVYDLYPPSLAQGRLLAQAHRYAAEGCQVHGVELHWHGEGDGWSQLPQDTAIHVYRILQQALTNVWTHANARQVWVDFEEVYGHLLMSVRDDGEGFDPELVSGEHLGMITMRERARVIGGHLQVTSHFRQGTIISLTIPVPSSPSGQADVVESPVFT